MDAHSQKQSSFFSNKSKFSRFSFQIEELKTKDNAKKSTLVFLSVV